VTALNELRARPCGRQASRRDRWPRV